MDYIMRHMRRIGDPVENAKKLTSDEKKFRSFFNRLCYTSEFGIHWLTQAQRSQDIQLKDIYDDPRKKLKKFPLHIHEVDRLLGILFRSCHDAIDRFDWQHAETLLTCVVLFVNLDAMEWKKVDAKNKDHKRVWESIGYESEKLWQKYNELTNYF